MDLFPCLGVPITATMPHFYEADPSLMEMIGSGLSPNITQHKMFVHMELVSFINETRQKKTQNRIYVYSLQEYHCRQQNAYNSISS